MSTHADAPSDIGAQCSQSIKAAGLYMDKVVGTAEAVGDGGR